MLSKRELSEKTGIPERALLDIANAAEQYQVKKIILFGSRAKGCYRGKSDIDLAVYGCEDFLGFSDVMEENVWTLLEFDLIQMEECISQELKEEIKKDGVTIYEKI